MSYIKRELERKFLKMSGAFKAIMVTGARLNPLCLIMLQSYYRHQASGISILQVVKD